jgi:hypothetical protein
MWFLHSRNGLQPHTAALTPKLVRLPTANPITRQKVATVAAVSTSSFRPSNLGLCSSDGADMMHKLEMYPFVHPKTNIMSMNTTSELIIGVEVEVDGDRCMLHKRNKGMKSVRAKERTRRRFADQILTIGNAHMDRPKKSPTLNARKWIALKRSG